MNRNGISNDDYREVLNTLYYCIVEKNCDLNEILESSCDLEYEELKNKIFAFGSTIKQRDYLERNMFVCLVMALRSVEEKRASLG